MEENEVLMIENKFEDVISEKTAIIVKESEGCDDERINEIKIKTIEAFNIVLEKIKNAGSTINNLDEYKNMANLVIEKTESLFNNSMNQIMAIKEELNKVENNEVSQKEEEIILDEFSLQAINRLKELMN